ncbi:MAG: hypothetical protein KBF54_09900, partial [Rhizobiales bacterium]|nr:hypothetical protein [Hyphomicrobiales bacterium]
MSNSFDSKAFRSALGTFATGVTVMTTVTASGGDLATNRYKNYRYEDPRMDLTGRGFLGFGKVTVFDPQLRSQTVTEFDHATSSEALGVPPGVTAHVVPFA